MRTELGLTEQVVLWAKIGPGFAAVQNAQYESALSSLGTSRMELATLALLSSCVRCKVAKFLLATRADLL